MTETLSQTDWMSPGTDREVLAGHILAFYARTTPAPREVHEVAARLVSPAALTAVILELRTKNISYGMDHLDGADLPNRWEATIRRQVSSWKNMKRATK